MIDRKFRLPRCWSNQQLRKMATLFTGDIVNVSAWDDKNKEGGHYRDYFSNASSYSTTNFSGYRGFQGLPNEYFLDLTRSTPLGLSRRFDVVFNHTTLEHIFDIRTAFSNICELSRDVVIIVVPFAQEQHESEDWRDYWRFTPTCLRKLHEENGLTVIHEAESPHRDAAVYLMSIASRHPDRWRDILPTFQPITTAGQKIGESLHTRAANLLRFRGQRSHTSRDPCRVASMLKKMVFQILSTKHTGGK